jgi:tetratricopeptide (TPR) repeat protein
MIRMQTGRLADALADYDRALALKPGNPPVLVGRGQARLLLKDAVGAAADFDQALRLSAPDWPLRRDVQALLERARSESR